MADTIRFDANGLVPVVVQDVRTGRVLMVAYANEEALETTRTTGEAHFWSRSRQELWRKGATSGNTMEVRQIRIDCDLDTVLYVVDPAGPACHTGTETCFSPAGEPLASGFAWLEHLDGIIRSRLQERPEGSYTVSLADEGAEGPARKVVEEATEVAFASKDHAAGTADDRRVAEEAGDLLYHLLVMLAERGIPAREVIDVLEERFG